VKARQRHRPATGPPRRQVNLRVDPRLYDALEALARAEQRSVAQIAQRLVSEALGNRLNGSASRDDTSGVAIAPLAAAGGAFTWLASEPDSYDDTSGEPL
jgi:hypothetical protein